MVIQNISSTEDQCAFSDAVVSTVLKSQLRKEAKVFLKKQQLFFLTFLVREQGRYISTQVEYSIPFKQLLAKEVLVNRPWRLHGPIARYY